MKKCKLCGTIIKLREIVDGKLRNFQRRKYCLKCSPFGSGNTKKLEIPQLYPNSKRKRDNEKYKKWQRKARKKRKNKLVAIFGGKCQICGYNKSIRALEFHHVNPKEKEITLSLIGLLRKWEIIIKEIKKCILVCSNCHKEFHANLVSQKEIDEIYQQNYLYINSQLDSEIKNETKIKTKKIWDKKCLYCKKHFETSDKRQVYCSHICSCINRRKMNRPSKEILLKEIEKTNYCVVGRKYGVSDNAIRKWLK
jgi:hypothetical protein